MEKSEIHAILEEQRRFFDSGATMPVYNRLAALESCALDKAHEKT